MKNKNKNVIKAVTMYVKGVNMKIITKITGIKNVVPYIQKIKKLGGIIPKRPKTSSKRYDWALIVSKFK